MFGYPLSLSSQRKGLVWTSELSSMAPVILQEIVEGWWPGSEWKHAKG